MFSGSPSIGDKIRSGYLTPAYSGYVTLASSIISIRGDKFRNGYLTPTLPGAQKRAHLLRKPLHSPGSPEEGTKSEVATSPLPSRGHIRGRNCYVTPAYSRVPKRGDKSTGGYHPLAFSGT